MRHTDLPSEMFATSSEQDGLPGWVASVHVLADVAQAIDGAASAHETVGGAAVLDRSIVAVPKETHIRWITKTLMLNPFGVQTTRQQQVLARCYAHAARAS